MKAGFFRTTAILVIFFLVSTTANSYETLGWKISWTASTAGNSSIAWDNDVGSHIETHEFSGSVSESSQGSYLIDANGYVVEGSSSGSRSRSSSSNHLNWRCGAGSTLQHVDTRGQSHESETLTGPEVGDRIWVSEYVDMDTGANMANFGVSFSCSGTRTYSNTSFNAGTCVPQDSSGSDPINQCSTPFWASAEESPAEDDTNLVFSSTGSRTVDWIFNDQSYVAGYPGTLPTGPVTKSWTTEIERIVVPGIHGIELTQAMQIYQELDALKDQLENNDGNPPIPLVAYKPLAIRVILEQPIETTDVVIEALWNDVPLDEPITLTQAATCEPPDTTRVTYYPSARDNASSDCQAADFIVRRPANGGNRLLVRSYSNDPALEDVIIEEHELVVNLQVSDTVIVGAVNVCATRAAGNWNCLTTPVRDLKDGIVLMNKIYPTDRVVVEPTGHQVRLEIIADGTVGAADGDNCDCYDGRGTTIFDGNCDADGNLTGVAFYQPRLAPIRQCEKDIWWGNAALRINRLFTLTERTLDWGWGDPHDLLGIERYYFGLVRPNRLTNDMYGIVHDIPGRAGLANGTGVADGVQFTAQDVRDTVAHEIGHLLGRIHVPPSADTSGCNSWNIADGPPELYLFSSTTDSTGSPVVKQELGFDVERIKVIAPFVRHDMMSYCDMAPTWASPLTYLQLFDALKSTASAATNSGDKSLLGIESKSAESQQAPPEGVAGNYWLVSGSVYNGTAYLETMFAFDTVGPAEAGEGSHRLEVRDGNGAVLFVRNFTPSVAHPRVRDGRIRTSGSLPAFVELVPVQAAAAEIVIREPTGAAIGQESLAGAEPVVSLIFPIGGEQTSGPQSLSWTATDADSDNQSLLFWVQYSADGGNRWLTLGQDIQETSLEVNFNELPGSLNNAKVRVLASDGMNTGTATSGVFSVDKKVPAVDILLPENGSVAKTGRPIFFEGFGYDLDDGILPAPGHVWTSDLDGWLATDKEFAASNLSEGTHRIELTVTDSDGNAATASVTLNVGAPSDADGDGIADGIDQCPGTPAGEAVDNAGCAASQRDTDNDGVNDALDQCPGTPAGTAVNNSGCTINQPGGGSSGGGGGGGSTGLVELLTLSLLVGLRGRRVSPTDCLTSTQGECHDN